MSVRGRVRGIVPMPAMSALGRGRAAVLRPDKTPQAAEPVLDYARRLPRALRSKDVDEILRCLAAGAYDTGFVRSVAPQTFSAVLGLLRPGRTLASWERALDHTWWIRGRRWGALPSRWPLYARFSDLISGLVQLRWRAKAPLGLVDYRRLLLAATGVANSELARSLVAAMRQDGLEPDADCLRAYLHCVLWDRRPRSRPPMRTGGAFRIVPVNTRLRQTGAHPFAPPLGAYVREAEETLRSLTSRGFVADEALLCDMMTAYARDNDIDSAKAILARFWSIDADALDASSPTPFPSGHAMRPTDRLLRTVAHVFGATNHVTTSLRLVDHISAAYRLPISRDVWEEIFVWTYSHSWLRGLKMPRLLHRNDRLDLHAVEQLWQVMTDEPYRVQPTPKMYHLSIGNLTKFQRYDIVVGRIREGLACIRADNAKLHAGVQAHRSSWHAGRVGALPTRSKGALKRRRRGDVGVAWRNEAMLRRWCKWFYERGNVGPGFRRKPHQFLPDGTVVKEPRDIMLLSRPFWAYRDVPDFLAEFVTMGPNVVSYDTHTGRVNILIRGEWPAVPAHVRDRRLWARRHELMMEENREREAAWRQEYDEDMARRLAAGGEEGGAGARRARDGIFTTYEDDDYDDDDEGNAEEDRGRW